MTNLIFVGGIHGVGKSNFCEIAKEKLNINSYSASNLIVDLKQKGFNKDKLIPDINENQNYLLMAIEKLNAKETNYLLDGHFCLLDSFGTVKRIEAETYINLKPQAIILLVEKSSTVAERRKTRDGITYDVSEIEKFQQEEISYSKEIAEIVNAPLYILDGLNNIRDALEFIKKYAK